MSTSPIPSLSQTPVVYQLVDPDDLDERENSIELLLKLNSLEV